MTRNLGEAQAAGLYEAMSCRLLMRVKSLRDAATFRGAAIAEPAIDARETCGRYEELTARWLWEPPADKVGVEALVRFIGMIAADRMMGHVEPGGGAGDYEERDALHTLVAMQAVAEWIEGDARAALVAATIAQAGTA